MLKKGFDQMVLIQQEITSTILINPYLVKLKRSKFYLKFYRQTKKSS